MPEWDPNQYLKYGNERTRPAFDLLARIDLESPSNIIDLGCGPGNSTALLHARWPEARIEGLDSSPAMIAAASKDYPHLTWTVADIAAWQPDRRYDLIFSNAALHWVPDHAAMIPHLFSQLADGGVLAIQMPAHFQSPVHRILIETAAHPDWNELTGSARSAIRVERPSFYYDLLSPLASRIDLWETEYIHHLKSHHEIIEWMRGTALRPFLEALTEELRPIFENQILDALRNAYPMQKDGSLLFPFRRLFIVSGRRQAAGGRQ